MKTYTSSTTEAKKAAQYYVQADLILQFYAAVKKEQAALPPRLPAHDVRREGTAASGHIYFMAPSARPKNLLIKMPFLRQLASKVAAMFF